jgi:hypothetical protein
MVSDAANGLRAFTAFFETISELDRTGRRIWEVWGKDL